MFERVSDLYVEHDVKVELKSKRYFLCPKCGEHEFEVEGLFKYLFEGEVNAGPWYCDECSAGWMIKVNEDGSVHAKECPRIYPEWLLLSIEPTDKPIYLRVPSIRFREQSDIVGKRFYVEENTCPTNLLAKVDEIWFDGDADPHGILRVVSVHDRREDATPEGCYHSVQD